MLQEKMYKEYVKNLKKYRTYLSVFKNSKSQLLSKTVWYYYYRVKKKKCDWRIPVNRPV